MHVQKNTASILLIGLFMIATFMFSATTAFGDTSYDQNWHTMNDSSESYLSSAVLLPRMEVPQATNSRTIGWMEITNDDWSHDRDSGSLNYVLNVFNGKDVTGAHLHCAKAGENGPIVVGLYANKVGANINGELASGSIKDSDIASTATNCEKSIGYEIQDMYDLKKAIADGDIYVNVHNKEYPDGATRGQLMSHDDMSTSQNQWWMDMMHGRNTNTWDSNHYENWDNNHESVNSNWDHASNFDSNSNWSNNYNYNQSPEYYFDSENNSDWNNYSDQEQSYDSSNYGDYTAYGNDHSYGNNYSNSSNSHSYDSSNQSLYENSSSSHSSW